MHVCVRFYAYGCRNMPLHACVHTCAHVGKLACMCTHADLHVCVYIVHMRCCLWNSINHSRLRMLTHFCLPELCAVMKSHTHALCYIKALLPKKLLRSSFSTREIKNRNIHALWMYFPSRKCAVVGVWHWLHNITCNPLPRLPLAGTCGALWRKAFLTGLRGPEELLETGRRTMSVEPGEQWGGLRERDAITMTECWGAGKWPPNNGKRVEIHRDDHMAEEVQKDRREQWFAAVTLREHVSWSHKFSWLLHLLSSHLTVIKTILFIQTWFHFRKFNPTWLIPYS